MNKKQLISGIIFIFFSITAFAQVLNDYKYVMVPAQFTFQKEEHQYNFNRLTKFLLEKYDFDAIIQGENLPENLNGCEALLANVVKGKGFLKTMLTLELKDCKGQVLFRSIDGVSREKDFKKSYHEAIRNAFKDPKLARHHYEKKVLTAAAVSNAGALAVGNNIPTSIPRVVAEPTVAVSISKPNHAVAKKKIALASKDLQLELLDKEYIFKATRMGYDIYQNGIKLGNAIIGENKTQYIVTAGALSGTGFFDDFGNFVLQRVNPVNKKTITDTMARMN
ncbi:hypothetical protein [Aquimarina agarilytica]|uniref:hypothetical protein n=1 Tax=Aquimarina agarilytica TaxID=1087449 RepID=UPI000314A6F0|nr:hypothetical protein [Aquimarina agarilytica]